MDLVRSMRRRIRRCIAQKGIGVRKHCVRDLVKRSRNNFLWITVKRNHCVKPNSIVYTPKCIDFSDHILFYLTRSIKPWNTQEDMIVLCEEGKQIMQLLLEQPTFHPQLLFWFQVPWISQLSQCLPKNTTHHGPPHGHLLTPTFLNSHYIHGCGFWFNIHSSVYAISCHM